MSIFDPKFMGVPPRGGGGATPHSVAQEYEMAAVILVYSALRIISDKYKDRRSLYS